MTAHNRFTIWVVGILTAGAVAMWAVSVWGDHQPGLVRACQQLDDQELVADCLDGVTP